MSEDGSDQFEGAAPGHDDDCEMDLLMPFLPVVSKGGPLDDQAYVCGYEAGRWDSLLASCAATNEVPDAAVLHEENAAQIDLIAMRHGFVATVMPPRDGWVMASFKRSEVAP